ncbi:MAG: hypothetical protein DA408_20075 [Bacteroidetes bacterium]|nr:MAG: hypothetical protein C7N36_15735 [Bacteroidota bacterium]PTM08695.1 MAG: hypothetical protein DA408_20075 [Bacteroidota bacterium]
MKRELNKYLGTLSDKELIKEIKKLYDKFPAVQAYYGMELSPNTEAMVAEYKQRIREEYFPKRGYGRARNSVSNKVIADFRKVAIHKKDMVDLLLSRTEVMLEFTNAYGDIEATFYNSLISSFKKACAMIEQESLHKYYRVHCQELVSSASNLGWGVHEQLKHLYRQCFMER